MLSINNKISLNQIEILLSNIHEDDFDNVLRLPVNLAHGGSFGISIALIQLITTCVRTKPDFTLLSYSSKLLDERSFKSLLQQPHGLIASYMAKHIQNYKHDFVDKKNVLILAKNIIDAMQRGDFLQTMHGRGVFLACLSGARNEYLLPLYNQPNNSGLRGSNDFQKLTKRIIEACSPSASIAISAKSISAISTLLRELVENTNDHAIQNEEGLNYNWNELPSVRAVFAKHIVFNTIKKDTFVGDTPLLKFLASSYINTSDKNLEKTKKFLELSVVDGGMGIARKWYIHKNPHKKISEMPFNDELRYIHESFEVGKTTKKETHTAGIGLNSVIKNLNKLNAFVRLRTGRLCLYQDFSLRDYSEFSPSHWSKEQRELSRVEGTAYTILIPITKRDRK